MLDESRWKGAWRDARARMLFPPLPEPKPSEALPFPGVLKGYQVFFNPKLIEEMARGSGQRITTVLRLVFLHELNHFIRFPKSSKLFFQMLKAVHEVVPDPTRAQLIIQSYLDLCNDTDLFYYRGQKAPLIKTFRASAAELRDRSRQPQGGKLYHLLVALLERLWRTDLGVPPLSKAHQPLVDRLAELGYHKNKSDDHVRDARKFAELLAEAFPWLKEPQSQTPSERRRGRRWFRSGRSKSPSWWPLGGLGPGVDGTPPPGHIPTHDLADAIEELAAELPAEELDRLLKEVREALGRQPGEEEPGERLRVLAELSKWRHYVELAEAYRIPIFRRPSPSGALYPLGKRSWTPEDPLEDLDILGSWKPGLPGVSQRWIRVGEEGLNDSSVIPDALVVIDSSGSMSSHASCAAVGAIAVANAYFDQRSLVAAYNFSSHDLFVPFTRERDPIYKCLSAFQGGGTILHVELIEHLLQEAEGAGREVDIILFSDLGIVNLSQQAARLARLGATHRIVLVVIGKPNGQLKEVKAQLSGCENVAWYCVEKAEDIPEIVIGDLTNAFSPSREDEDLD